MCGLNAAAERLPWVWESPDTNPSSASASAQAQGRCLALGFLHNSQLRQGSLRSAWEYLEILEKCPQSPLRGTLVFVQGRFLPPAHCTQVSLSGDPNRNYLGSSLPHSLGQWRPRHRSLLPTLQPSGNWELPCSMNKRI